MPRKFTQKVITKLQVYIEQCHENSEYIYGSNESRITEKTIASLKNNKVIVSKINETKAREIIHQEFKNQFQEMIRRITEKMKQTFPNIP
jgi:CRISPR/Cas system CMR subunit Cmr6 (Cas7 group RAMP superfamily)